MFIEIPNENNLSMLDNINEYKVIVSKLLKEKDI